MPCAAAKRGAKLRIVLDTNDVLSALLWRGTPYRLLQIIRQREDIKLFFSGVLLDELAEVLTRPDPAKRLALYSVTAHQMLADYIEAADLVTPRITQRVIADDPDDDHVIAAAIEAGAEIIVSGDRHLLTLGAFQNVRICTPADALAMFSSAT